ncbi:MAG TPA: Asd/ArgC dimerization domain-containing protein [Myxococcota bacterium]
MTAKLLRVAVVGATGTFGRELIEQLGERHFPIQELVAIASEHSLGEQVEWLGHELPVVAEHTLSGLDLVFLCTPPAAAPEWMRAALVARVACIDCSGAGAAREEIPLLDPERAPSAPALASPVIAVPSPAALALARVVSALRGSARVERVLATVCESASSAGRAGIDALQAETVALFAQQDPPEESPFSHGVAFDALPATGPIGVGDLTASEAATLRDFARLAPGVRIAITALRVPTFAGLGVQAALELEPMLAPEVIEKLLDEAPGTRVFGTPSGPSLRDAAGEGEVLVGRVRADPTRVNGILLWLALDPVRVAATAAVRLAELRVTS